MKKYNKIRLKALILDLFFIAIMCLIIMLIYAYLTQGGTKYERNLLWASLYSLFLCKDNIAGQSVGERLCKLKTVDDKGENLNTIKLIGRNLFVLFGPIEVILLMYYDKRLADRVMQTKVVLVEKSDKVTFKGVLTYILSLLVVAAICFPLVGI